MNEVINAYKILFGSRDQFDRFSMPDRAVLKSAYRKKVKLFHPDLASQSSLSEERLQAIFLKISNAYDTLSAYLGHKKAQEKMPFESIIRNSQWEPVKPNVSVPTQRFFSTDYYYTGEFPQRKLRFGEFLFYSGRINWNTFMDSLVYQCKTRPMIGAICVEFGFIYQDDVEYIMAKRDLFSGERFGEVAVRLEYLSKKEVSFALRKQYQFGQPFGKYFLDKDIMTSKMLQRLLSEFHLRNVRLSA